MRMYMHIIAIYVCMYITTLLNINIGMAIAAAHFGLASYS